MGLTQNFVRSLGFAILTTGDVRLKPPICGNHENCERFGSGIASLLIHKLNSSPGHPSKQIPQRGPPPYGCSGFVATLRKRTGEQHGPRVGCASQS